MCALHDQGQKCFFFFLLLERAKWSLLFKTQTVVVFSRVNCFSSNPWDPVLESSEQQWPHHLPWWNPIAFAFVETPQNHCHHHLHHHKLMIEWNSPFVIIWIFTYFILFNTMFNFIDLSLLSFEFSKSSLFYACLVGEKS